MFCPLCYNNLGDEPSSPCVCGWRGPSAFTPSSECLHYTGESPDQYCGLTVEPASCNGMRDFCNCYFNSELGIYEHHPTDVGEDKRNEGMG